MGEQLAYLVVGHGTRRLGGQEQFRKVFSQFAQCVAPQRAELAFLELAEPDISQAIASLAAQGVTKLVTIPVLLFAAGHALEDIPSAVQQAAEQYGIECLGQSAPLESEPRILELSALRFRQAVCHVAAPASCLLRCERAICAETALVMVGRGSRSESATAAMRQFSELRRQITPVAAMETGFIVGQTPTVDQALQWAATTTCSTVVVQPHLLFEGLLMDQLREQVATCREQYPQQRWYVTQPLGIDFALAETLASLAAQVGKTAECG
jgi:sirohydrochlorin cobaltochelatase